MWLNWNQSQLSTIIGHAVVTTRPWLPSSIQNMMQPPALQQNNAPKECKDKFESLFALQGVSTQSQHATQLRVSRLIIIVNQALASVPLACLSSFCCHTVPV